MDSRATLVVSRREERDIRQRTIDVYLDGELVGELAFGDRLTLEISAGRHRIKVSNRLKNVEQEFSAAAGEALEFHAQMTVLGCLWTFMATLGTPAYGVLLERKT